MQLPISEGEQGDEGLRRRAQHQGHQLHSAPDAAGQGLVRRHHGCRPELPGRLQDLPELAGQAQGLQV